MANIIYPPNPLRKNAENNISIFLSGSIEMDQAEHWQAKYIQAMDAPNIVFLNPRHECWDCSVNESIKDAKFREQVEWELKMISKANVVVMYFDPDTQSAITLLELGLLCGKRHARYTTEQDLLIACPTLYWKRGNVEMMCDMYQIPLYNCLDELIENSKKLIRLETAEV